MTTFAEMVAQERDRLGKAIAGVLDKMNALTEEMEGHKRELRAVDAYEAAKTGKVVTARAAGSRAPRGSRQDTLHALIAGKPDGMTRGEILTELGIKGDKAAEGSISNALNGMKKSGKLLSKDGKYIAV